MGGLRAIEEGRARAAARRGNGGGTGWPVVVGASGAGLATREGGLDEGATAVVGVAGADGGRGTRAAATISSGGGPGSSSTGVVNSSICSSGGERAPAAVSALSAVVTGAFSSAGGSWGKAGLSVLCLLRFGSGGGTPEGGCTGTGATTLGSSVAGVDSACGGGWRRGGGGGGVAEGPCDGWRGGGGGGGGNLRKGGLESTAGASFGLGVSAPFGFSGALELLSERDIVPHNAPMPIRAFFAGVEGLSIPSGEGDNESAAGGGRYGSSSQIFSTTLVRMKAHRLHVVRNRVRHQPEVQRGYMVAVRVCVPFCWEARGNETGRPDEADSSLNM